jgi:hypothetical protein
LSLRVLPLKDVAISAEMDNRVVIASEEWQSRRVCWRVVIASPSAPWKDVAISEGWAGKRLQFSLPWREKVRVRGKLAFHMY